VEIRVPARTFFSHDFGGIYPDIAGDPRITRETRDYLKVMDLRPAGHDAILHAHCKHGKEGMHKLELLDTGGKTYAGMLDQINRVFDCDPRRLETMRVDLCADVSGIGVPYFQRRMFAQFKQFAAEVGEISVETLEYMQMGKRGLETCYWGKRPNCYRCYDKTAERFNAYMKLVRRALRDGIPDADVPDFETWCGWPENEVRTRIERQMGGGRVPEKLATMALLSGAAEFNPFDRLRIIQGTAEDPDYRTFTVPKGKHGQRRKGTYPEWLQGVGLRCFVEQVGMHHARRVSNVQTKGHAKRLFDKYEAFMPSVAEQGQPGASELAITSEYLYDVYRESVGRQLAA
jgi:hypothetical protein